MKAFAVVLALLTVAGPALAANARHPNRNVDHRNDRGGDTGDSRVDQLNQQQLDLARAQNGAAAPAPMTPPAMPAR